MLLLFSWSSVASFFAYMCHHSSSSLNAFILDRSLLLLFFLSFSAPFYAYTCCAGLAEHYHG